MATLPQEFIDLAAELIGDEFAAFAPDCVFTQDTGWDEDLQQQTQRTKTIPMIRLEYKHTQYNGNQIKIGDYMLIGEYDKLNTGTFWEPSTDNTKTLHEGIAGIVKAVNTDPAKATLIVQVRAL